MLKRNIAAFVCNYIFKGGNMVSEKEKHILAADGNVSNRSLYNGVYNFGEYILSVLMYILSGIKSSFLGFIDRNEDRINALLHIIGNRLKKLGKSIAHPFVRWQKAMKLSFSEVGRIRHEKGKLAAAAAILKMLGRALFGKRGLAYSLFNYALPIICVAVFLNIVSYANSMTYSLKLTVNGDFVGYVANETVFTEAERIVQQRINYMDTNTEIVTFTPAYQLEMTGQNDALTKYQLADKLLASMDAEIVHAYGLYIGNAFYGALTEKDKIDATLEELLDVYRTGAANEKVAFENTISYEPGLYLAESIVNEDDIIETITAKKNVATYYTAVEGDSPIAITTKLGMTMSEFAALNPGFSESTMVYIGDKFLITQEEPYLAVTVTRTEVYDENTAYDTEYYNDSTKYQGSSVVTQNGIYGTDRVTADVSYINGVEVRRKVLNRITVEEPTPKIVALGTKTPPSNTDYVIQNVEVGQMYWPVGGSNGGLISEMPYGYGGYYGHKGLDISAPYGTPIYAADSGTVTLAKWYGDYGYCVMIEHDNGIVTVYGHASYLHVYAGQRVTQGQQIADVGSTGRSTGNHLHFEVRINGICMNPINYLPKHEFASWCVHY